MRWVWLDKFVEFTPRQSATAVKNITMAEEHLHDLYPDFPIVPHSLIVEGMAQTAGILVGEARQFKEKVILAKIGRATFHRLVQPGDTLRYHAQIEQLSEHGASIRGTVTLARLSPAPAAPATQLPAAERSAAGEGPPQEDLVAEIELMFSHIDKNLSGIRFPEHNFVFTGQFTHLLESYRMDTQIKI